MDTKALDFVVVNTRTGNACAAFLLPRDALHYIKWRCEVEGPHGSTYEIRNAHDDWQVLQKNVYIVSEAARREHTRLNPNWS